MPKRHDTAQTRAVRNQFAANLRAAMADAGIGNAELARRVKVGASTVGDWVSGRSAPSLENITLVAREVRQSVSWLCGDAMHGLDTIEQHERHLALRLGGERLRALRVVPDDVLLGQIDLLIRSHLAAAQTSADESAPRRTRRSRRK